jgi:hypothetical protein
MNLHKQLLGQALLDLTSEFPFDHTNSPAGRLCAVRKLDFKARLEWVFELTLSEAQAIWGNHDKCMLKKKNQESS